MYEYLYNNLSFEIVFFSLFLLSMMLFNGLTLYKSEFNSPLTKLLIAGIGLAFTDFLWVVVFDNNSYSASAAYAAYFLGSLFSLAVPTYYIMLFVSELYDCKISRRTTKWLTVSPLIICTLIYFIFTPKGHALSIEEVDTAFSYTKIILIAIVYPTLLASIVLSVSVLIRNRKTDGELRQKAVDYFSYSLIAIGITVFQLLFFDPINQFSSLGMSCALCYLTIRRSTNTLVNEEKNRTAIETELNTAAKIQISALPNNVPAFEHHSEITLNTVMYTAKEVGGDFYDYYEIDSKRVCFLMADVSGKGVSAAMFMMKAKTIIKDTSCYYFTTAEIFNRANKVLCEDNAENMFATAWIGILDTETMILQYTNAGHNFPYISKAGREFSVVDDRHGMFLGGMKKTKYKQSEIQLEPGDRIFLYTDGLTEAHNRKDELYSDKKLADNLNRIKTEDGQELLTKLKKTADEFADGALQFDDITMMIVTVGKSTTPT